MAVLKPDYFFKNVTEITPAFLEKIQIKGLVLDVDNTLAFADDPVPFTGVLDWIDVLQKAKVKLLIVSNNTAGRVSRFAEILGLDYISFALKPFPVGFRRARKKMALPAKQIAAVGDQLFTDITGAKLAGLRTMLIAPARMETSFSFRVRRKMEKRLLQKYKLSVVK